MGVILTGHIDVPADRLSDIEAALPEHVRLTRAEPGCVWFEVGPDREVPGRFRVAERFVDRAAFDAHQRRAAGSAWGRVSAGLTRDYRIEDVAP